MPLINWLQVAHSGVIRWFRCRYSLAGLSGLRWLDMRAPVKMFTDDIDNLEQINMFSWNASITVIYALTDSPNLI